MANYILKEMNDLKKVGKRIVYPKMETFSQMSLDNMVKYIREKGSPFAPAAIRGVVETLLDATTDWLSNGHTIKIDGLGTFSLSLQFADDKGAELKNDSDGMPYRRVEVKTLNFRPAKEYVDRLRRATDLTRSERGVKKVRKMCYTKVERRERAVCYIGKHGFITLNEYVMINNVSRAFASHELNEFTRDTQCRIRALGRAPHKVWELSPTGLNL